MHHPGNQTSDCESSTRVHPIHPSSQALPFTREVSGLTWVLSSGLPSSYSESSTKPGDLCCARWLCTERCAVPGGTPCALGHASALSLTQALRGYASGTPTVSSG